MFLQYIYKGTYQTKWMKVSFGAKDVNDFNKGHFE